MSGAPTADIPAVDLAAVKTDTGSQRKATSVAEAGVCIGLGVVAAIPLLVTAAADALGGWVPAWDEAGTLIRARDVFSAHPPLVGQFTQGAQYIGRPLFGPGPMLFWLFSPPTLVARWWPAAPLLWSALFGLVVVIAAVWVGQRVGGRSLAIATALAILALEAALTPRSLILIWNPNVPILAMILLALLATAVLVGIYRYLAALALVASFVVQTELSTLAAAGLVCIAVAVSVAVRWRRSRGLPSPERGLPTRGQLLATGAVLLVCWLPPLIQELTTSPGNLGLLWRAARLNPPDVSTGYTFQNLDHVRRLPKQGFGEGVRNLAKTLGAFPVATTRRLWAGHSATALGFIVLAALVVLLIVGIRRRSFGVAGLSGTCLCICAGGAIATASLPTGPLAIDNWWNNNWMVGTSALCWATVCWGTWRLLTSARRLSVAPRPRKLRPGPAIGAAIGVAALGAALVLAFARGTNANAWAFPVIRRTVHAIEQLPGSGPYTVAAHRPMVRGETPRVDFVGAGVLFALRVRGYRVYTADSYHNAMGTQYWNPGPPKPQIAFLNAGPRDRPPASRPNTKVLTTTDTPELPGVHAKIASVVIYPPG